MKKILSFFAFFALALPMMATEVTIWSGSHDLANWSGFGIDGYNWKMVYAGTPIKVYFSQDAQEYDSRQLTIADPDWNALNTNTNCVDVSEKTSFTYTLTTEDLAKLSGGNMIINGKGITVTMITLDLNSLNIMSSDISPWDNSTYDSDTKTLSVTEAWKGGQWWYGDKNFADFNKLVVEFESATTIGGAIGVGYNDGQGGEQGFDVGATKVELVLDADRKAHLDKVEIKLGDVGSVQLKSVEFVINSTPTGLNSIANDKAVKTIKYMKNGRIVIEKDGVKYNILGQPIAE